MLHFGYVEVLKTLAVELLLLFLLFSSPLLMNRKVYLRRHAGSRTSANLPGR